MNINFSFAWLTLYEKVLSKRISTILVAKDTKNINEINLSTYWITYVQKMDEAKRILLFQEIDNQIKEKGIKETPKEQKNLQVVEASEEEEKQNIKWSIQGKATTIESQGKTLDYTKIQQTRMSWLNDLRTSRGLDSISYDSRLGYSAEQWNQVMITRDQRSHQRNFWDSFYNYKKIETWFVDIGLKFKNTNRTTFVENVGVRRWWKCSDDDCSDEVIKELRGIFDYYLAEEGKKNNAHFQSMINPYFKIAWLSFDISASKKLYFTVHYGTEIIPVSN